MLCLFFADLQAQPSIRLIDSTKKSWMPEGNGTVGLRFRNAGNQPLVITTGKISSNANVFKLQTNFTVPKVIAPGDTSYVTVEVNAQIAYEYLASIVLFTNDPSRPTASFSLRVNDSIPPNPVRSLKTTPLANGQLAISWLAPSTARDKDSIVFYRVFIISKTGEDEEVYTGKATTHVVKSALENDVYVSVLSYDDMGNRSVTMDTTWLDHSKPRVWISEVDEQMAGIPEHLERGNPRVGLAVRDWHMGKLTAYWREPGSSQLNLIGQVNNFPQFTEEHTSSFRWNTSQLRGKKELVIISSDQVANIDTVVYSFTKYQIKGWPKRMLNHSLASSSTIAKDEGGRFVITGSDIANGVFRPNGHHYFYNWPWDIIRGSSDQITTASADFDADNLSEIVTLSRVNRVMVLDHHGMSENEFGGVSASDRFASIVGSGSDTYILAGASPVAAYNIESEQYTTFGASGVWRTWGDTVAIVRAPVTEGVREKDRFVIGNIISQDRESVVQVHDNGEWEEIIVRNSLGKIEAGPVSVWRPTTNYTGFYPSLGDIDGDNSLDIVLPAANDSIYAYHADGTPVARYPVFARTSTSGRNQALLADLDRDGAADIILPVNDSIIAISGRSGSMIRNSIWPIKRASSPNTLLTIADLNSDGYLELIEPPAPGDTSWVYVYDLDVRNEAGTIEWGTFQHDMQRSGNYNTPTRELQSGVRHLEKADRAVLSGDKVELLHGGDVRIVDILGRTVRELAAQPGDTVELSDLASGVYMINIDELEVIKIVR
jgi:hypothetical protein